mgnify:CR=1 FL=1
MGDEYAGVAIVYKVDPGLPVVKIPFKHWRGKAVIRIHEKDGLKLLPVAALDFKKQKHREIVRKILHRLARIYRKKGLIDGTDLTLVKSFTDIFVEQPELREDLLWQLTPLYKAALGRKDKVLVQLLEKLGMDREKL